MISAAIGVTVLVGALLVPNGSVAGQETRHAPCGLTHPSLSTGPHNVVLNGVRVWYRVAGQSKTSGLHNTGEIGAAFQRAGFYDTYRFSEFANLTMPVLVVAGRHDGAVGFASQEALARVLPHGSLAVFEHSAHFPYVEEPDQFRTELAAFLQS